MFICQMCGKVSPAGTKSHKVTVASRPKTYKGTPEPERRRRFGRFREAPKQRDPGGHGHEIAKELTVCASCSAAHQEKQAQLEAAAKAAATQTVEVEAEETEAEAESTAQA